MALDLEDLINKANEEAAANGEIVNPAGVGQDGSGGNNGNDASRQTPAGGSDKPLLDLEKLIDEAAVQNPQDDPAKGSSTNSAFAVVAQVYVDKGVLPADKVEEVIKEAKSLDELIAKIEEQRTDSSFESLTPEQRQAFDAYVLGADTNEYNKLYKQHNQLAIIPDSAFDEAPSAETKQAMQTIVAMSISAKNPALSQEEVSLLVNQVSDDALASRAKTEKNNLVALLSEKMKGLQTQAKAAQEAKDQAEIQKAKAAVEKAKTEKELFGQKISETTRKKMVAALEENHGTNGRPENFLQAAMRKDPDLVVKLAYLFAETDGFKTLSRFVEKGVTVSNEQLSKLIAEQSKKGGQGLGTASGASGAAASEEHDYFTPERLAVLRS